VALAPFGIRPGRDYRKHGFVEEGRRAKQLRRANGQLWDIVDMGLLLARPDDEP